MDSVKVTGIRFDWGRLKRLPSWIFEMWPVLVPSLLVGIHVFAVQRLCLSPDTINWVNRWVAAGLQILGVGFILYSVDANLREFRLASLKDRFGAYIQRFPLLVLPYTLSVGSSHNASYSIAGPLRPQFPTNTIEGRLKQLESDVTWLETKIATQEQDLRGRILKASESLGQRIDAVASSTQAIADSIKKQTRDGVPSQIFGALLVVHSALAGVFT